MSPAVLTMRLLLAAGLGAATGIERELRGKPAGLRTNILIAVGAALFTTVSLQVGPGWDAGSHRRADCHGHRFSRRQRCSRSRTFSNDDAARATRIATNSPYGFLTFSSGRDPCSFSAGRPPASHAPRIRLAVAVIDSAIRCSRIGCTVTNNFSKYSSS